MVTNVLVLSPRYSTISGADLEDQPHAFGQFHLFYHTTECSPVHVVLALLHESSDYAWLRDSLPRYSSCPITIILKNSSRLAHLAHLLAKQVHGLEFTEGLNENFISVTLQELVERLDAVYSGLFDELDVGKKGHLRAADFLKIGQEASEANLWPGIISGNSSQVSKDEFVQWWRAGKQSCSPALLEVFTEVLTRTPLLHACGHDVQRMLLRKDVRDEETKFHGVVRVGDVPVSPMIHLKCRVDTTSDSMRSIIVTLTLLANENVDVETEKSNLKESVADLLNQLKPLDKHGKVVPNLQLSYSSENRKVVVTLTIDTTEGEWKLIADWLTANLSPLLQSGFEQFLEVALKSDIPVQSIAEDPDRSYFECLADGCEMTCDAKVWSFYQDLLNSVISSASESFFSVLLCALKGGDLQLEFGSTEELPSVVLQALHEGTRRLPFLSLLRVREFLGGATNQIAVTVRRLLTLLATKFDSKHVGMKARFLHLAVASELSAPGLFQVFIS